MAYRININGITRDMTDEEIAELQKMEAEHPVEKSADEKLADLQTAFDAYKTQVEAEKEENDAALMEVASLVADLSTRADEHEEAIMELGDVVSD